VTTAGPLLATASATNDRLEKVFNGEAIKGFDGKNISRGRPKSPAPPSKKPRQQLENFLLLASFFKEKFDFSRNSSCMGFVRQDLPY